MSGALHAYFTAGLLAESGKSRTVGLGFTKPWDATDVKITFWELDTWLHNGRTITENNGPLRRLIGEIAGVIEKGKFRETASSLPFSMANRFALYLTVVIDNERITMPLTSLEESRELDFFEITFKVTANVNGVQESYDSPSPLFIRNTSTPRAEVAFIAGTPRDFPNDPATTAYFPIATQFWRNLRDNERTSEISLRSILNFLRDDDPSVVSARHSLPWGRINIVSHGNQHTWFIRRTDQAALPERFRAATIPTAQSLGILGPPRRQEVDEHSEIIIRGCELGDDTALLNAIRDLFGGLATVYAPRYENAYRQENGIFRDRFFEHWSFTVPGNVGFPTPATIQISLKTKYSTHPIYGKFTDGDWLRVSNITGAFAQRVNEWRQSDVETMRGLEASFDGDEVKDTTKTGAPLKSQAQLTALMKTAVVPTDLSADDFDSFAWTWRVVRHPGSNPPQFLVSGNGVRTYIDIFRLLTAQENGRTVPVTPNYMNPAHFGRSS